MARRAQRIFRRFGVQLDDSEDIKRAFITTFHDDWEVDLYSRCKHFDTLRRAFGTPRCTKWVSFCDHMVELGNPSVNQLKGFRSD